MTNSSSSSSKSSLEVQNKCHYLQGLVWQKEYLTEEAYGNFVALTSLHSIAVVPTIFFNLVVILAVVSKRRLQTTSHILLACLAGIDLFGGIATSSIAIALQVKRILGDGSFCELEKALTVSIIGSGVASCGQVVLVSIDRYIAIKHPLRYLQIATRRRVKHAVLLNLGIAAVVTINEAVLAAIDSGTKRYFAYSNNVSIILSMVISSTYLGAICITYCYIFSETRRQMKRLKSEQVSDLEAKRWKKHNKATNTLALLLSVLVLSYLPSLILFIVEVTSEDILEPSSMIILWNWVDSFWTLSGIFHPVIYCWRSKTLRQVFLEILHLRRPVNAPPPIEMQVIAQHRCEVPPTRSEPFSRIPVKPDPVLRLVVRVESD